MLGFQKDTSLPCNFTDITSVGSYLYDGIIVACQMNIMEQGTTAFRPHDTLTRAEFGTYLSRTLWGNTYNGGSPYYQAHLNALKNAGIMPQIDDPLNRIEVRGYVFMLLLRMDKGYVNPNGNICQDPLVLLLCAMQADGCPVQCQSTSRYPGCDTDDIKVGNYTIAACNVGASKAVTGSIDPNKGSTYINKEITPEIYGQTYSQMAAKSICAAGYHLPTRIEWEGIYNAGKGSLWYGEREGENFASILRLPNSNGTRGEYYRTYTPGILMHFDPSIVSVGWSISNSSLELVRCFKD